MNDGALAPTDDRAAAIGSRGGGSLSPPPASSERETRRCRNCGLVQFIPSKRECRRCHQSLDEPSLTAIPTDEIITDTESITDRPAYIRSDRIALANYGLAVPFVVYWLRIRRGISQRQLADKLGVMRTWLVKVESGRSVPTIESLVRIAEALGVEMPTVLLMCEQLMGGSD